MSKNIAIFLKTILFCLLLVPTTALASDVPDFNLQVPIFDYTKTPDIAHYIAQIYISILYVLVPLAIVIIIYAGSRWIMSGGDPGKIQDAKKYIISAFTGLFIAFFSYFILSEFGLTTIGLPNPSYITPEPVDDSVYNIPPTNLSPTDTPGAYKSVGGQCFPVAANSLAEIHYNYGDDRAGGNRHHVGLDIYTKEPGYAVAIADGIVKLVNTTFKPCCCSKGWYAAKYGPQGAGKILIYHPSLGVTVNYGEVANGTAKVTAGQQVKAGTVLGIYGPCRMVHFEIWSGDTTATHAWYVGQPRPASLIDPTNTIKSLVGKMCGGT